MLNLDLTKVKKEHLLVISIILIITIGLVAYNNVLKPLLGRISVVSGQIKEKKRKIQRAEVSFQTLAVLEDEIRAIKIKSDYYEQKLQAPAEMPQILKELNQMAERLKVKIVSVNPLEREETVLPGSEEFLLETPLRIKLQCGYHQLGVFINQIENSTRLMKISELKISSDSRDIWTQQVELVVTNYGLVSQ
ncbi:MAG: type 4a pilus biogenesis protein PilO [Omnitrophica bacterium]|nr:type 4a pilus biogenesis protein PilO [Candidatus Omnitrophota bacterium]